MKYFIDIVDIVLLLLLLSDIVFFFIIIIIFLLIFCELNLYSYCTILMNLYIFFCFCVR